MRGIISASAYVPYWRLDRAAIAAFHGGRGKGTRSVASYDEDTTTLAVEAGRLALRGAPLVAPNTLWFATAAPTYLEKTNAAAVHAALRLEGGAPAYDAGGAVRSGIGALRTALGSTDAACLVTSADIRTGMANSPDEAAGGDAGAAALVGDGSTAPLIAEFLGAGSATREFLDRWRTPGDLRTKQWEERFTENRYIELGLDAYGRALDACGLTADDITTVVIAGPSTRANNGLAKKLGATPAGSHLAGLIGNCGTAEVGVQLAVVLEQASPGQTIAVVSLCDGADVLVFRTTDAITEHRPVRPVADQIDAGNSTLPYAKYLAWRGVLPANPPNRPEPARTSGSAAGRSVDWKFGFVASQDNESGAVHMPPARVSFVGGNVDDMSPLPMADAVGTVVTFTVDRLAYSPSPPVIFAVVDFDGGGRMPVEVCDVTADGIAIGDRVEMTFRRIGVADGIANYFWKARPQR